MTDYVISAHAVTDESPWMKEPHHDRMKDLQRRRELVGTMPHEHRTILLTVMVAEGSCLVLEDGDLLLSSEGGDMAYLSQLAFTGRWMPVLLLGTDVVILEQAFDLAVKMLEAMQASDCLCCLRDDQWAAMQSLAASFARIDMRTEVVMRPIGDEYDLTFDDLKQDENTFDPNAHRVTDIQQMVDINSGVSMDDEIRKILSEGMKED